MNTRPRRALGCAPTERITADRAAMLTLPPVPPATGWRSSTRLAPDHYVRLDSNDYSVHPAVIGRRIEVTAELHHVGVLCDGRVVADHERVWARPRGVGPRQLLRGLQVGREGVRVQGVGRQPQRSRAAR